MATLGVLEECLTEFSGAVILVTHDRYFLDQVANKILAFPPLGGGELIAFADLYQWEEWHTSRDIEEDRKAAKAQSMKKPEAEVAPVVETNAKKKKLNFKEQREFDSMEATIHAAEEKLARLTQESELPENATNAVVLGKISTELAATQAEIDRLYRRWSELGG
jgi:ATP-binding cassette subfamily F protein uup